ncbi:hypothetical protein FQR65_LT09947 [Abscondita terminalis]|nr:hypothetical protein FQR65_LT09947 [Abscondita terminalis]
MASGRTVRQVKHGERLRRSQNSLTPISTPDKCLIEGCKLPSTSDKPARTDGTDGGRKRRSSSRKRKGRNTKRKVRRETNQRSPDDQLPQRPCKLTKKQYTSNSKKLNMKLTRNQTKTKTQATEQSMVKETKQDITRKNKGKENQNIEYRNTIRLLCEPTTTARQDEIKEENQKMIIIRDWNSTMEKDQNRGMGCMGPTEKTLKIETDKE